jgi:hypothetical protein
MELIDTDRVIFTMTASILPGPGRRRGDFMATIKVTAEKKIDVEYRFRWWNTVDKLDMDGGADDDEKSFFSIKNRDGSLLDDTPENREKAIKGFTAMQATPGFARVHIEQGEWTPAEFILDVMQRGPMRTQLTREDLPK